jgi:flagellar basal body rod protein FlgG
VSGGWVAAVGYNFEMRINNAMAIASSAMRVETQRLAQSAANTANVQTPEYEAQRVDSVSIEGGGVRGVSVATYGPHAVRVEEGGGTTQLSNTDLVEETVTQMSSLRAFQANASVLRTADEMLGELVRRRA